jgi:tetraacyldisaccharide 4'-kinase
VEVAAFRAWRDHHRFTRAELVALAEHAVRAGCPLVTTEKDLARITGTQASSLALVVARIEAVVHDERVLLTAVERALAARRG